MLRVEEFAMDAETFTPGLDQMVKRVLFSVRAILSVCAVFYMSCQSAASVADATFEYEPSVSTISGVIRSEYRFGPPNYGEDPDTDKRIQIFIVRLEQPIDVLARPDDEVNTGSFRGVTEMQIIAPKEVDLLKHNGKYCSLKGQLFQKISGAHFTDVLMQVFDRMSISCRE